MFIVCRMVALSVKNDIIQVQTKNVMRVMRHTAFFSFCRMLIRKAGDFFIRPTAFFVSLSLVSFMVFISASAEDVFSGKNIFQDGDGDGLSNEEERLYATDPFQKDTDGDGYSDGVEVKGGYDPLKKAPGDKIIIGGSDTEEPASKDGMISKENLTQKLSTEVAKLVSEKGTSDSDVSLGDLDSVVSGLIGGLEDTVFPVVSKDEIKVRLLSKKEKKLSVDERKKKEEQYIVEYLTSIAYILANNSPGGLRTEDAFQTEFTTITNKSINALSSGDLSYVEDISRSGEKVLEQLREVEVPEAMVDLHLKALQMAKYAVILKDEFASTQNQESVDPLRSISVIAKVQGFMDMTTLFIGEFQSKLLEYGISGIPIEF